MNTIYGCYFTDNDSEEMLLFACDTVEQVIVAIYKDIDEHLFFPIEEIRLDWDCENDENPTWGLINIFADNALQCRFVFERIPYIKK